MTSLTLQSLQETLNRQLSNFVVFQNAGASSLADNLRANILQTQNQIDETQERLLIQELEEQTPDFRIKKLNQEISILSERARKLFASGKNDAGNNVTDVHVRTRRRASGRAQLQQAAQLSAQVESLKVQLQQAIDERNENIQQASNLFQPQKIDTGVTDSTITEKPQNNTLRNLLLVGGALVLFS